MTTSELTFATLRAAVAGDAAAIRAIVRLQPAGGEGDKVFPPTYAVDDRKSTKYAEEVRRIGGKDVPTVLLDSVASQANRMEEALLEAWKAGDLKFPIVGVDFTDEAELGDLEMITSLQAPHRLADAILRDSIDSAGVLFRHGAIGKEFSDARPTHATAVFKYCPTALVFGVWDSTGPKGGLGAKFPRALVSEIIGVEAKSGVKTASRIDPLQIMKESGVAFQAKDDREVWTLDETKAKVDPKNKGLKVGKDGKPSEINHGNVAPSVESRSGGVTIDYALQTAVLSLPALRRLRFGTGTDGKPLPDDSRREAEVAARTALAALAVAGIVYAGEAGHDLRSRALLIPEGPLVLEILPRWGGEPTRVTVSAETAARLVKEASAEAARLGLAWITEPVRLKPSPKLAQLVRESRKLAAASSSEE